MKRKQLAEEQIIGILKESEAGAKKREICRKHGISVHTFYRWRSNVRLDAGVGIEQAEGTRG